MKVVAYTALHYGRDYLAAAIRSVIDAVDEYWVLYSAVGSHGHRSGIPCPETKDELYAIARDAAGTKLRWRSSEWAHEGLQRDSIHQYVPDADVILTLDADEVWQSETVDWFLTLYRQSIEDPRLVVNARRCRVPMIHAWRSFNRWVLHDPAFPARVLFPRNASGGEMEWTAPVPPIFHFGYAQRSEIVEYKQHVHGHKGEWRRDVDWFRDRFMANAQHDCHPVGSEWWNPEQVDPYKLGLPEWMRNHSYAALDVIP